MILALYKHVLKCVWFSKGDLIVLMELYSCFSLKMVCHFISPECQQCSNLELYDWYDFPTLHRIQM